MDVISFRILKELEKSIKEIGINLGEEIGKFIETKVKEQKKRMALEEIDAMLSNIPKTKRGTAKRYVREDGDSN